MSELGGILTIVRVPPSPIISTNAALIHYYLCDESQLLS